jgi:hypothetical protein
MARLRPALALLGVLTALLPPATASAAAPAGAAQPRLPLQAFFDLIEADDARALRALQTVSDRWHDAWAPMLVEAMFFAPSAQRRRAILKVLEGGTGQTFGAESARWWEWIWRHDAGLHPDYASYKARVYGRIDPAFSRYFSDRGAALPATIRLDEVRWGGVKRDGIPPLDHPATVGASAAGFLDDAHVVFGFESGGETRAYPRRIMGWHEVVRDRVGGTEVTGVYSPLCGTMVVYRMPARMPAQPPARTPPQTSTFGTSGFVYRSSKLLVDAETDSLWSTLTGRAVVGSRAAAGAALEPLPVVTTTWGAWRRRHPETSVVSLDTGFTRDYSEGAAYRDYLATDRLMFGVPQRDDRLADKAEVLALRFGAPGDRPVAIAADLLLRRPLLQGALGGARFVVLTDPSGANRVYSRGAHTFARWDGEDRVIDEEDRACAVAESGITCGDERLPRLPAHRAFWFGWFAAFPETELIR